MPWTYDDPPEVARNWTKAEQRRCVNAANAVLDETGDERRAILACIAAARRSEKRMNQKTYHAPIEVKAGESGEVEAVFATLNVIDHDGDVTLPGAFGEQRVVIEPWNHNQSRPPVGKGRIYEKDGKAILLGRFFMDTEAGREHHAVIKNLADMQEWSYTFRVVEAARGELDGKQVRFLKKLKVAGVGPVTVGAGIDTHTVSVKSALASHSTPTTDADWDGPANEARARSGEDEAYYRRIYAWRDPDGDPTVKASYKFPHHMVASDGTPGAANVNACQAGIGVLNGARGGADIPNADRREVWNHLARHLRDADVEPQELKAIADAESKQDEILALLREVRDMLVNMSELSAHTREPASDGGSDVHDGKIGDDTPSMDRKSLAARIAIELLEDDQEE